MLSEWILSSLPSRKIIFSKSWRLKLKIIRLKNLKALKIEHVQQSCNKFIPIFQKYEEQVWLPKIFACAKLQTMHFQLSYAMLILCDYNSTQAVLRDLQSIVCSFLSQGTWVFIVSMKIILTQLLLPILYCSVPTASNE